MQRSQTRTTGGPEREDPLSPVRAMSLLLSSEMDDPLDDLLRLVGEGLRVSRTYLFQFGEGGQVINNTHEWCAPGVDPQIQRLRDLPSDLFPWWIERLRTGEGIAVSRLAELPPEAEAEREILESQSIHAVLVLPLVSSAGELMGFMGFDEVTGPREWTARERESLELICDLGTRELERRRAIVALGRMQRRLVRTERIARVGGWEFQPENGVTWWSEQARELLGIPHDKRTVTLFECFQRIHPDDRQRTRRAVLGILDDGRSFRCECRALAEDATVRHLEIQGALLEPERGPSKVVGTLQDITQRRRLEEQLHQAQRMDAVGRLAGGVAHDFNNLLAVILGSADFLLQSAEEGDPRRHDLQQIRQAAERGASLSRQLLAFSSGQTMEPRTMDLGEAVLAIENLVRRLLPDDVRLEVEVAPEPLHVFADPGHLEQVLINLVVNARDAMAQGGGVLRLATRRRLVPSALELAPGQSVTAGSYAVVSVEDEGMGMTPELRARIFEPFFTTKPEGEGTGLGLSSAWGIVQQSGGAIQVESEPGKGSRFLVHLPEVPAEPAVSVRAPSAEAAAGLPGGTILVVEDEAPVIHMVRRILEQASYRVLTADLPHEALELSAAHHGTIDLLVTDVVMPEVDGRLLADQIREQRPGIRVLYMSGHPRELITRKGIALPSSGLLEKPFTAQQLLAFVGRALAPVGAPSTGEGPPPARTVSDRDGPGPTPGG